MSGKRQSQRTQQIWWSAAIAAIAVLPWIWWGTVDGVDGVGGPGGGPAPKTPSSDGARTGIPLERIEGWVPYWGDPVGTARAAARAGCTDLLFFGATLKPNGTMRMEQSARMGRAVEAAHAEGASSWLTVANHGESLAKVLTPGNRGALVERLAAAHRVSGCAHLDLDLEQLSRAQWAELPELVVALKARLPVAARLGVTLQPADSRLRPWAVKHVRAMLADPAVFTVRFMCYDYHWRTSLPGALYPRAAFERLLDTYRDHAGKLCVALPLYGYDWPRPADVSMPGAKVVTVTELKELSARAGAEVRWMEREAELALFYMDAKRVRHMAAVPSFRTIADRAAIARRRGVGAVAFWHLGCGGVRSACEAVKAGAAGGGDPPSTSMANWAAALEPFKRKNCRTVTGKAGDSFAKLAKRHGVSRSALYRFNEDLTDSALPGRVVYLPIARTR